MKNVIELTQEEKIRIKDLANVLVKNQDAPKKQEEIISKLTVFVEGVKLGLLSRPAMT